MHVFVIPGWFTSSLFVTLAAFAIWRGGGRERVIAIAQGIEMPLSTYLCSVATCRFGQHAPWVPDPMWRPAIDDGVILAICLACLVRAERYWIIWACSFALLGEISDLTIFATEITRWAWLSASLVWSYAVAGAVLWGVLTHRDTANDRERSPSA
jgi:hypothetical protein